MANGAVRVRPLFVKFLDDMGLQFGFVVHIARAYHALHCFRAGGPFNTLDIAAPRGHFPRSPAVGNLWGMSYKPEQLPFLEYREIARNIKRAFDKHAGHYPLEIKVTNSAGRLLMQQRYANVWDRKSSPVVLAEDDWDTPVNVEIWENGTLFGTTTYEEVKARPLSRFVTRPIDFGVR